MTTLTIHDGPAPRSVQAIALPEPRAGAISIRQAVPGDEKLIDFLQRDESSAVGWFPMKQLEGYVKQGHVLMAIQNDKPIGYCIARDRYFKRDDCGIIYQLNIVHEHRRGLAGATLIKAVFDRAAYGCKLFCCWCAQDLQANHFWESLGFVPLAFRAGSRPRITKAGKMTKPGRTHIFWQRRIREGDSGPGATPYWFPSETTGGAIREGRIVLPIPPGTHWSDAKPAILPGMDEALKALPPAEVEKKPRSEGRKSKPAPVPVRPPSRGVWVAPPTPPAPTKEQLAAAKKAKKEKAASPRFKNDPKLIAAARELRDRYLEQINARHERQLPAAYGKYDVGRQLAIQVSPTVIEEIPLLNAA